MSGSFVLLAAIRIAFEVAGGSTNGAPVLPNADFRYGSEGWVNAYSNKVDYVSAGERGLAVSLSDRAGVHRNVDIAKIETGKEYILSCDILPTKEVSTAYAPDGLSGLGCTMAFFSEDWKRSVYLRTAGAGNGWMRIRSRPTMVPDWVAVAQLEATIRSSDGGGLVDNIRLDAAYSEYVVKAESTVGIRQVKIVNDLGETVFDSGAIKKPSKSWRRKLRLETPYSYCAYAVDASGDVARKAMIF